MDVNVPCHHEHKIEINKCGHDKKWMEGKLCIACVYLETTKRNNQMQEELFRKLIQMMQ